MKKAIFLAISLFFALCLLFLFFYYTLFYENVKKESFIFIKKNSSYQQVLDSLIEKEVLTNTRTFKLAAKIKKYPTHIRHGNYLIKKGEGNLSIIRKLMRGQHYPVKFTFNNIRTKEGFVKKLENKFLFTADEFLALLNDSTFLAGYDLTVDNSVSFLIPNTYEIYYDISATEFFDKMYSYYQAFWSSSRLKLASEIGLSPTEVVTLASIVEEENFRENEKAIIAGLYINRLQKGMKLQADPTIKFALGDFTLQRILHEHLTVESPYNTYLYEGLPPGPIRIPAISTVDSVLHYRKHNFLYMCAKEDFSGSHHFTANANEHYFNAARYQRALKKKLKK